MGSAAQAAGVAVEVKSARSRGARSGLAEFETHFAPDRTMLVGGDGVSVEEFLTRPVEEWIGS